MAGRLPNDSLARDHARRLRAQQVRRRRLVLLFSLLLLLALIVVLLVLRPGCDEPANTTSVTTAGGGNRTTTTLAGTHRAKLTGAGNIPPIQTNSTGLLTLDVDPAESTVSFVLQVDGLINTSIAHIFQGQPGSNGQAVVTLFDGPTVEGPTTAVIAQGKISANDLTGPLEGKSIADLITLIQSGDAYCTVGNTSHPEGAIRGQIE